MYQYTFYDQEGNWQQSGEISVELEYLDVPDGLICVAGYYSSQTRLIDGVVVDFSKEEKQQIISDKLWGNLRIERNRKLTASDWTQVPDAPVDQAAWAAYRQALRDLPANTTDPANPIWPTPPQ